MGAIQQSPGITATPLDSFHIGQHCQLKNQPLSCILALALDAKVYFAHPYHSWERGLNENTHGLIRQYIPKGSDFSELEDADMLAVQEKLNNRPRKALNYTTPNEYFEKLASQRKENIDRESLH